MSLWKKSKPQATNLPQPTTPQDYPAGICVKTPKGTFFINKDGKRYRVPSDAVEASWSFPIIVNTSEAAVVNYPVAVSKLPFRDGSLLNNIADGKIYLVSGGVLRHVVDPNLFSRLGITKQSAVDVSQSDINSMKIGGPIA